MINKDTDLKGINDVQIPEGQLLCRKLRISRTGRIQLSQLTTAGSGWLIVVQSGAMQADRELSPEIGDVLVCGKYAGAPVYDMTDEDHDRQGAFYFVSADDILMLIPGDTEKASKVYATHDVIRNVDQD